MSIESSVLQGLRRPEYTGKNRCLPCTAINVILAIVASLFLSMVWLPLAVAMLGVSLLAIYLRGYLVPGTPELTQRYLPDSVLAYFEHETPSANDTHEEADQQWDAIEKLEYRRKNEVESETFLRRADAIRESDAGLVLTDGFRGRISDQLEIIHDDSVDDESLATLLDTTPEHVEWTDRSPPAIESGSRIRRWPSDIALIADVASHEALLAADADWLDVPIEQRIEILRSLRSFFEHCPACAGPVSTDDTVVESCCRSIDVITVSCDECEERLVEMPTHATAHESMPGSRLQ